MEQCVGSACEGGYASVENIWTQPLHHVGLGLVSQVCFFSCIPLCGRARIQSMRCDSNALDIDFANNLTKYARRAVPVIPQLALGLRVFLSPPLVLSSEFDNGLLLLIFPFLLSPSLTLNIIEQGTRARCLRVSHRQSWGSPTPSLQHAVVGCAATCQTLSAHNGQTTIAVSHTLERR